MVLLEISQNSQENTCTRASFLIKFQAKRDSGTGVFLWILRISKNTFVTEQLRATASVRSVLQKL